MNTRLLLLSASCLCMLSTAKGQVCCDGLQPPKPETLIVEDGYGAVPPMFAVDDYHWEFLPEWATDAQLEIWQSKGVKTQLFARVWMNDSTLRTYYFEMGDDWGYKSYLRAGGPSGERLFPVGTYEARWRGWNPCGYGEWSDYTTFQVTHDPILTADIVDAPSTNESTSQVDVSWTNNARVSVHQVQIKSGKKVVRRSSVSGHMGYGYGFWYDGNSMFAGNYVDRPSNPTQELPDGSYTFSVRSYSPALKRWSAWATTDAFALALPDAVPPVLELSQEDFDGLFDKSTRPYFYAQYGNQAPRWSFFEIHQKVGSKSKVVRREWVRSGDRYGYGAFSENTVALGGGSRWNPPYWNKDLPAGEYTWRVLAWNGRKPQQSVWSGMTTSTLEAPGPLAKPENDIDLYTSGWGRWQEISWSGVSNAYAYEVNIYRNGKLYRKSPALDVGKNMSLWANGNESVQAYWSQGLRLPVGAYTFKARAVNKSNTKLEQYSEWSDESVTSVVQTIVSTPSNLVTDVYTSDVFMDADFGPDWLKRQYEVVSVDCSKFTFTTDSNYLRLPPGTYTWRVRQWNVWRGWSAWSVWSDEFEIEDYL